MLYLEEGVHHTIKSLGFGAESEHVPGGQRGCSPLQVHLCHAASHGATLPPSI